MIDFLKKTVYCKKLLNIVIVTNSFEINPLNHNEQRKRDFRTLEMLTQYLETVNLLITEPNETIRQAFISRSCFLLSHFCESGGSAAEVFARLQAYGMLNDFPVFSVLGDESTEASSLEISNVGLQLDIIFRARPMNEKGEERFRDWSNPQQYVATTLEILFISSIPEILSEIQKEMDTYQDIEPGILLF